MYYRPIMDNMLKHGKLFDVCIGGNDKILMNHTCC